MQPNDDANENFLFCKCLPGRCMCEIFMLVMQMFEPTLMVNQKFITAFLLKKQIILFNLEFRWSLSRTLPSKINLVFQKGLAQRAWVYFWKFHNFDWKWDKSFFFGLAHEFSTIEHYEKRFLFGWILNKFNVPLKFGTKHFDRRQDKPKMGLKVLDKIF